MNKYEPAFDNSRKDAVDGIKVWIPEPVSSWLSTFNKVDTPEGFRVKADSLAYLVSVIYRGMDPKRLAKGEGVHLHSRYLERIVSKPYKAALNLLERQGVVLVNDRYQKNGFSKSFIVRKEWIGERAVPYWLVDKTLVKAICNNHPTLRPQAVRQVNFLERQFTQVSFDASAAKARLDEEYRTGAILDKIKGKRRRGCPLVKSPEEIADLTYTIAKSNINNMGEGDFMVSRSGTNRRVHSLVTSLEAGYRQHISFKGYDSVSNVDIANCQPFLLSLMLRWWSVDQILKAYSSDSLEDLFTSGSLPSPVPYYLYVQSFCPEEAADEFNAVSRVTTSGQFYEWFAELASLGEKETMTREEAKATMFPVLYSANRDTSKAKRLFEASLPHTYAFCHAMKEDDHARLAIVMQRFEAWMFIDHVAPVLDNLGIPFVTIHDSVLVPTVLASQAEAVIKGVFTTLFNEAPTVKVERVN